MSMDRTLETRKVQFTGNSTYTISLPKEWADHHGVEAGMQLPLYPVGVNPDSVAEQVIEYKQVECPSRAVVNFE